MTSGSLTNSEVSFMFALRSRAVKIVRNNFSEEIKNALSAVSVLKVKNIGWIVGKQGQTKTQQ